MRKLFFTLVVLLSILSMGATVNLKITTYNIRHGLGVDNVFNFQRVKETIQKINPDQSVRHICSVLFRKR